MKHRILVMAHSHPDFTFGGGELAAFQLYKAFKEHPDVEAATFLGRISGAPSGQIRPGSTDEYLWQQSLGDRFLFQAANPSTSLDCLRQFLEHVRPDVVFAHHFVHMGVEIFRVIKEWSDRTRVILTLHEMLAICHHHGQMIKTGSLGLCKEASPDDCRACFPGRSREDFWLRKKYLMRAFEAVDHFVTPSEFLKTRFMEWGLAGEKISVIENGQETVDRLPPRTLGPGEARRRFGFFGQITPYKGLDVLFKALLSFPEALGSNVVLEVNGANLEHQPKAFLRTLIEPMRKLEERGMLIWRGPYDRKQMRSRFESVDWVLLPSIWWENSPLVIQEAFGFGRPVICSGIGGMAEKVRNEVDGLHVEPGDVGAWSSTIARAAQDAGLWDRLASGITGRTHVRESADRYLQLTKTMLA